mmetsp:Transcript_6811/g.14261  ORF Transcript_6811/g.14261 Transcript_6811/m.14261 type:complete len:544 (-) Transcript_6811:1000-2631(-)
MSDRTRRKLAIPALILVVAILFSSPQDFELDFDPVEEISKVGDSFANQWKELARLAPGVPDFSFDAAFFSMIKDSAMLTDTKRPGQEAKERGLRKSYPIVIIPGATTTGLEIWKGKACAKAYFKQRLWGSMTMFSSFASMDGACWLEHISMNLSTGLDPDDITVRPAEGLSNVEYFMPGFGIWAQVVESLADIGYDNSDLYVHPYDWRMDALRLQKRDGLLTRMKHTFESSFEVHNKPACVLTHSYGDTLMRYFMSWVESDEGGKGGRGWVDKYIHRYVNIGGPTLGVPKVVTALLSGDTSDSIWLPDFGAFLTDRSVLSKSGRSLWFRSMSSGSAMLPHGGEEIWGKPPHETFLCISGPGAEKFGKRSSEGCVPYTTTESIELMFKRSGEETRSMWEADRTTWGEALVEPLPLSKNLKIYCLYGVGVDTERAYNYRYDAKNDKLETDSIIFTDGDGTVPLISLGYMCAKGWKTKKLNPSGVKVTTREYQHKPATLSLRGGPGTSDHVNILLNAEVIGDILEIAAGIDVQERIVSNIHDVQSM